VNLKEAKKQWWSVWSKDQHTGASCALCGAARTQTTQIIEGLAGYVCAACVFQSVGVLATVDAVPKAALRTAGIAVGAVLEVLPGGAAFAVVEPMLDAMLRLAPDAAAVETVFVQAMRRGHTLFGYRALTSIPAADRPSRVSLNLAATCIDLERFDEASHALAAARESAEPDDAIFLDCHEAILAAHTGKTTSPAQLEELVRRARHSANEALVSEALEALARHHAALGELAAALTALAEAITLSENAALLLLRGDLLASSDLGAARDAWQATLEIAHPEGIYASRAHERLARPHPYRSR
jgi:tetratricopeptide (TPR) repeat protein